MPTSTADAPSPWTIQKLIGWAAGYLKKHGVDSPRLSAEVLLATALGASRIDLYVNYAKPLEDAELKNFKQLLLRRARREPLAYITGVKEFWSMELRVTPAVLIPRPETECLVEAALAMMAQRLRPGPGRILELGTGSGAVVIALATEQPQHQFTATDVSPAAVQVASENARRHGADSRIDFICADGFEAITPGGRPFDFIVSNPPYIRSGDLPHLAPEITEHEPHLALDGTESGLAIIHLIIERAPSFLKPGGRLLMEIGYDQGSDVRRIGAAADAYADIALRRDLNGHTRVAVFTKK